MNHHHQIRSPNHLRTKLTFTPGSPYRRAGITIIEITAVIAILMFSSIMLLTNITSTKEKQSLNKAALETIIVLEKARDLSTKAEELADNPASRAVGRWPISPHHF